MSRTRTISVVIVFAALTAMSDSVSGIPQLHSGVWYSWVFLMVPVNGIILGPFNGSVATLLGVFVGHFLYFRGVEEFLFAIGAAVGSAVCGFIWTRRVLPSVLFYTLALVSYFATPISFSLPVWGMWDTYCAYLVTLLVGLSRTKSRGSDESRPRVWVAFSSFIGLEADVLFRIFLFIPVGTYRSIYGFPVEILQEIWVLSAVSTPLQVAMGVVFSYLVVPPTLRFMRERMKYVS